MMKSAFHSRVCTTDRSEHIKVEEIMKNIRMYILGLILLSCSNAHPKQEKLQLISYSKKAGVGYSVCVDDGYAYVTNNDGVVIFDVHQPEHPRRVSRIPTGVTFGIDVENGRAYISGENGLVIVDVHDPENPGKRIEFPIQKSLKGLNASGSYVFVASEEGMDILDVSVPGKIVPTGFIGCTRARKMEICEHIVYLSSPITGVEVIDISDPALPGKLYTVPDTEGAWSMHMHGEFLYVGCHGRGVKILDISDRRSPSVIGSYRDDDRGEALGVWGDGEYLYVADNYNIEVLDVSDPSDPREIGAYDKVSGAHSIVVDGAYIYVAEARKGLMIFQSM